MRSLFTALWLFVTFQAFSQTFTNVTPDNYVNLSQGSFSTADFNHDSQLDILNTGAFQGVGLTKGATNLYANNGSYSLDLLEDLELDSVFESSSVWGDFNNDGNLDFVVQGSLNDSKVTNMYFSNGSGAFNLNNQMNFENMSHGDLATGDLDNDGDLDLISMGGTISGSRKSIIYLNNGDSTFNKVDNTLQGLSSGSLDLADFDRDGDLDILICGETGSVVNEIDEAFTLLYQNIDGQFELHSQFEPIKGGEAKWIDSNVDGRPDVIVSGFNGVDYVTKFYINQMEGFSESTLSFTTSNTTAMAIGDINSDGYPDVIHSDFSNQVDIYINNQNDGFEALADHGVTEAFDYDIELADLDGDLDLDLMLSGDIGSAIFSNNSTATNTSPSSPTNLSVADHETYLSFNWDESSDNETPSTALFYNFFLVHNGDTIVYPYSHLDGTRKIQNKGNASINSSNFAHRAPGDYTLGVQTIDQTLNASTFTLLNFHINYPPVIEDIAAIEMIEDEALEFPISAITITDPDNSFPDDFSFSISSGENYEVQDQSIIPAQDFFGDISMDIRVYDGSDSSNVFPITISVLAVNDAPVIATIPEIEMVEDQAFELLISSLSLTDPDNSFPNDFTYSISEGENYEVDNHTITPAQNFFGNITMNVRAFDGSDSSNVFPLTVTVLPVNDAPVIEQIESIEMIEDETFEFPISALTITDPDNSFPDDFTFTISSGENYEVQEHSIIPAQDFFGDISMDIRVYDGSDSSNVFPIAINVVAVNDAPNVSSLASEIIIVLGNSKEFSLGDFVIIDPDHSLTEISINLLEGDHYSLNGLELIPETNFIGDLTVRVQLNDGVEAGDIFTFTVNVSPPLELESKNDFIVYPNPTEGFVKLVSADPIHEVELYTLTGKSVSISWQNNTIDLSKCNPGIYHMIVMTINEKTYTKRIIIK